MNKRTKKALEGSIAKWEAIVAGTGADRGSENCPLCKVFYDNGDEYCFGCPVSKKTGKSDCYGSPYEAWAKALCKTADTDAQRALAQAELDFLKSLREKANELRG
jgi:hypothetical protein